MEFVIPPPRRGDPRRHLRFREIAVDLLRGTRAFGSVSRRLLTDLMDVAEHHDLRAGNSFGSSGVSLLLVLEGEVVVERTAAPAAPRAALAELPSVAVREEAAREAEEPRRLPELRPGVYLGGEADWTTESNLRIRTTGKEGAYVIFMSRKEMARWLRASPTLLHSIGFSEGYKVLVSTEELWGQRPQGRRR
jgi:hypothetical protein